MNNKDDNSIILHEMCNLLSQNDFQFEITKCYIHILTELPFIKKVIIHCLFVSLYVIHLEVDINEPYVENGYKLYVDKNPCKYFKSQNDVMEEMQKLRCINIKHTNVQL